jgi:hypothetical protein
LLQVEYLPDSIVRPVKSESEENVNPDAKDANNANWRENGTNDV